MDEAEIQTAEKIIDVVPVNGPVVIPHLVNAIADRPDGKLSEAFSTLTDKQACTREDLEPLRQELTATREARRRIERNIEERDRKLTEALAVSPTTAN